jgi:hypothetical protein
MAPDITAAMVRQAEESAAAPEGVTVLLVTPDRSLAERAAPYLADRLYPGRRHSGVLYAEAHPDGWLVTVRDMGITRPPKRGTR